MNKILVLFGFLILLASPAFAGIPVDSGDYTGSRSTPPSSGVSSTGGYLQENGGFKIDGIVKSQNVFEPS